MKAKYLLPPSEVRRHYSQVLAPGQVTALDLLFGLRACVQTVEKELSKGLGDDALTPGRFQVLTVLWAAQHPVPQREIVNALGVTRATVSHLVDGLLTEGHVHVTSTETDKRQVLVELTPTGRRMTMRLVQANAERLENLFRALEKGDSESLARLLSRLATVMSEVCTDDV
ncbi:MarR family winged helix-turn-helix transcriptional regulator [Burkholderia sp. BCC0419]|uniref:MarR family winged helix-turn-helix transcriptional regulator n=1 Tax=Burkholderia sp. BCC0419 TaxID=486878 RepID=UPI00158B8770|nr:MarR family winged helix-turn-helix transcriptional regulator [Burkholderia sp. BCC0419]